MIHTFSTIVKLNKDLKVLRYTFHNVCPCDTGIIAIKVTNHFSLEINSKTCCQTLECIKLNGKLPFFTTNGIWCTWCFDNYQISHLKDSTYFLVNNRENKNMIRLNEGCLSLLGCSHIWELVHVSDCGTQNIRNIRQFLLWFVVILSFELETCVVLIWCYYWISRHNITISYDCFFHYFCTFL